MKALLGLGLLFGFAALGEGLSRWLHWPLPGSVVGLALLWLALSLKLVRPVWVEEVADALLGVLGLLFVPAAVGLVQYLNLWRAWPLWLGVVACAVLVGALVAGKLAAALER